MGLSPSPRAHPRSRGENDRKSSKISAAVGSSPLTRGKRSAAGMLTRMRGLIPAHAGKTRPCRSSARGDGAHPRSRGENSGRAWPNRFSLGSSPLTRGKRRVARVRARRGRLIPAHAGKTRVIVGRDASQGAHPRSRGENMMCGPDGVPVSGSSPLTRGKRTRA